MPVGPPNRQQEDGNAADDSSPRAGLGHLCPTPAPLSLPAWQPPARIPRLGPSSPVCDDDALRRAHVPSRARGARSRRQARPARRWRSPVLSLWRPEVHDPTGAGTYATPGSTIDRSLTLQAAPGATWCIRASTTIPGDQWERVGALAHAMDRCDARPRGSRPGRCGCIGRRRGRHRHAVGAATLARHTAPAADHHRSQCPRSAAPSPRVSSPASTSTQSDKWLYVGQDPAAHAVQAGAPHWRRCRRAERHGRAS